MSGCTPLGMYMAAMRMGGLAAGPVGGGGPEEVGEAGGELVGVEGESFGLTQRPRWALRVAFGYLSRSARLAEKWRAEKRDHECHEGHEWGMKVFLGQDWEEAHTKALGHEGLGARS